MFIGLCLFIQSNIGYCPSFLTYFVCTSSSQFLSNHSLENHYSLPQASMYITMVAPLILSSLCKSNSSLRIILISWLITIFWLIISIYVSNAYSSLWTFGLYIPSSLLILYQHQLNRFEIRKLIIMKDDFLFKAEFDAKEQQSMVTNVTHDLKTPMSGLSASLNNIKTFISDCKVSLNNGEANDKLVHESLDGIEEEVRHMTVMNIFMFESINRVLDVTKTKKGMKLVPKNETISIAETLCLPVSCMKEIQSKIKIELLPINVNISSHIITDKQWFQENMICLLSNAVKYSSEGEVTISISKLTNYSCSPESNGSEYCDLKKPQRRGSDRLRFSGLFSKYEAHTFFNNDNPHPPHNVSHSRSLSTSDLSKSISRDSLNIVSPKSNLMLLVEVQDTGIGISQEVMDELFSPFKQAQRLAGGTGLGLYSLAKRVEALNGSYGVKARSDGKQGSNFWFTIPYKADHIAANEAKEALMKIDVTRRNFSSGVEQLFSPELNPPTNEVTLTLGVYSESDCHSNKNADLKTSKVESLNESAATYSCFIENINVDKDAIEENLPKLNILLVDDSLSILRVIGKMLNKNGHIVAEASNGEQALRLLDSVRNDKTMMPIDVVILDLQMPIMDGFECTKRLRKKEKELRESGVCDDHQLVIVCSANSDEETSTLAYDAGVDEFLEKPLDIKQFMSAYMKSKDTNEGQSM